MISWVKDKAVTEKDELSVKESQVIKEEVVRIFLSTPMVKQLAEGSTAKDGRIISQILVY